MRLLCVEYSEEASMFKTDKIYYPGRLHSHRPVSVYKNIRGHLEKRNFVFTIQDNVTYGMTVDFYTTDEVLRLCWHQICSGLFRTLSACVDQMGKKLIIIAEHITECSIASPTLKFFQMFN